MAIDLIIFGSAALGAERPRDIDVAYTGDFTPEDEAEVRRWAAGVGIWADLPIDAHAMSVKGALCLPTPAGTELSKYVRLRGSRPIDWVLYHDLPARVRAYGHDARMLEKNAPRCTHRPRRDAQ